MKLLLSTARWRIVIAAALLATAFAANAGARPNVLFLIADDHSYEAIRSFGLTDIDTPNLDRLVRRGTSFTRAYNMGSYSPAVCVASRTMLITGRSLWQAQRIHSAVDKDREAGRLWPQLMAGAGYKTYFTGKWHIQADATKAFDVSRHVRPGMPKDDPAGYNRPLPDRPDPWDPADATFGGFWEGGKHWSEVTADDAVDYLRESRSPGQPFFMYVAFNAPHDPRQSPQEFLDRYPLSRMKIPETFQPEYPYAEQIGAGKSLRDERLGPFPRTEHAVKVHRREYYAIISHLDAQIGRILDALDQTGAADNTWIFFTADHGLAVGHHGLFGKQNLYEHSTRVPFVVAGPGVGKNRKNATPIYLQDVMPTCLDLAGISIPEHVHFHSLLPLLKTTRSRPPYPAIYGAYLDLQRSVTADDYKLIVYPKASRLRLYNLKKDPSEASDLMTNPREARRAKSLFATLTRLQHDLGDTLDLSSLAPR